MKPKLTAANDIALGATLFLSAFTALNLLGEQFFRGFNGNHWWIRLPGLEGWPLDLLLALFSVLTTAFCVRPRMSRSRRWLTLACFTAIALIALWNALQFAVLLYTRTISSGFAVPLSLAIAALMAAMMHIAKAPSPRPRRGHWFAVPAGFLACAAAFPFLQMLCFGKTDYRRTADAVVVFGARTYADGRLSDALHDRIRTACDLYERGLARKLILSGGPGDGPIHETEAMKRYAIRRGVPEADIVLDPQGLNTSATVRNTTAFFDQHGIRRVLAVSHFYHLPRVKMAYQRAGWEVYTVPAQSDRILAALPLFMAREIAALGKYYFTVPPTKPLPGRA